MAGEENKIDVVFGANIEALVSSLTNIRYLLEALTNPIHGVRKSLGELGEAFAAAFAVEKVKQFAEEFAEMGAEVADASHELGMSAEAISTLNTALGAMGISGERGTFMLMRLERNIAMAAAGTGPAVQAFEAMGLSLEDLQSVSPEEMLNKLADAFSHAPDGINKTTIAMELMGRTGAQMIPFLDAGTKGLKEFQDIANQTNTKWSDEQAEAAERTNIAMNTLGEAFKGLGKQIFEDLEPALDELLNALIILVEDLTRALQPGNFLGDTLRLLGAAIVFCVEAFERLIDIVDIVIRSLDYVYNMVMEVVYAFGKLFGFGGAGEALHNTIQKVRDDVVGMKNDVLDLLGIAHKEAAGSTASTERAGIGKKPEGKDFDNPAELAALKKQGEEILSSEMQMDKLREAAEKETVAHKVAMGQMGADEEKRQLTEIENAHFKSQSDIIKKESEAKGQTAAEQQKWTDKMTQLRQEHENNIVKIADKAALDDMHLAAKTAADKVAIDNKEYEDKKQSLENQARQGQITYAQMAEDLKKLTVVNHEENEKQLQDDLNRSVQGTTQWETAHTKLLEENIKFNQEMRKIDEEAQANKLKMETAQASETIKLNNMRLEATKAELENELDASLGANAEKEAQLVSLTDAIYQNNRKQLVFEQQRYHEGTTQFQEYTFKLQELELKHELDMEKMEKESLARRKQANQEFIQGITQSFDQYVRQVFQGTLTVQQAFLRMIGDMIIQWTQALARMAITYVIFGQKALAEDKTFQMLSTLYSELTEQKKTAIHAQGVTQRKAVDSTESSGLIGIIGNMLARWLGFEAAKTAGTAAETATRQGVEETAAVTSMASDVLTGFGRIQISAAVAAAGAFADMAELGLYGLAAAPGVAAETYGTVLGWAAGLGGGLGLEVGAWEIPGTMSGVTLHEGESVVPKNFAEGLRQSGVLGDPKSQGSSGPSLSIGGNLNVTTSAPGGNTSPQAVVAWVMKAARNGSPGLRNALKGG